MKLPDFIRPDRPVLIAGPTASGKSALALAIAEAQGGVIVNADASQVFDAFSILTARPGPADLTRAPHLLYGHVPYETAYSVGDWLRDIAAVLRGGVRPIIVGGTGLYFSALTEGLAAIPVPGPAIRAAGDAMSREAMIDALDAPTRERIDLLNRARVQRAWEVLTATGRGLAAWQDDTPPPLLPLGDATAIHVQAPKDWLSPRIVRRFDMMVAGGAIDEVAALRARWNPALPASKAIGAPEIMAYLAGRMTLSEAREAAIVATTQYAKRQRTWFRGRMRNWHDILGSDLG